MSQLFGLSHRCIFDLSRGHSCKWLYFLPFRYPGDTWHRAMLCCDLRDAARSCLSSRRMLIYKVSMEETRCAAVFPGHESPVLMLRAGCSLFTLKPAHSPPYLPPIPDRSSRLRGHRLARFPVMMMQSHRFCSFQRDPLISHTGTLLCC